jgi:hypothetical protein
VREAAEMLPGRVLRFCKEFGQAKPPAPPNPQKHLQVRAGSVGQAVSPAR